MIARQFASTVAAVMLLTASAQAGAVVWSYSSAFVSLGANGNYPGTVVSGGNLHSVLLADLTGTPGKAVGGNRTVTVGTLSPGIGVSPENSVPDHYRLDVSVKDVDSGESGTLVYYGRASEATTWLDVPFTTTPLSRHLSATSLGENEMVWLNSDRRARSLRLGDHEYRVNLRTRTDPDSVSFGSAYIDAEVKVTMAVATPEPGTLVLAGLAVAGGVGAWWRRNRRSPAATLKK